MDISRRGLLTGAGAIGSAAVLGSAVPARASSAGAAVTPDAPPGGLVSLSTAPEAGVSYKFAMWADASPLNSLANGRIFASSGVYANPQDIIGAVFDLPPGALVHDVEAYYRANLNTTLTAAVWASGTGDLGHTIASVPIDPVAGTAMRKSRIVVPSSSNGPYPHGTKLAAFIDTLPNASIQVNGFRVGYRNAPLAPVLLTTPVRVYDSRDHSPLVTGQTRSISLASHLPTGANGAMYSLSVLNTHGAGSLHVGAAGSSLAVVGIQWGRTGDRLMSPVTCAVNGSRAIGVHSTAGSGKTDFIVDLTGYLV
jgi:hypothetical protein